MVTVKEYESLPAAFLGQTRLGDAGIPSFIPDEHSATLGYGSVFQPIRLQVPEQCAEKALAVLSEPPAETSADG